MSCTCPPGHGYVGHLWTCPDYPGPHIQPVDRADWFDVGTLRPRSDEDGETNEGLADWQAAAMYGGRDVD